MQQLVDDLHRDRLHGTPLLRREVGQPPAGPSELPKPNLLRASAQRGDGRHDAARGLPGSEALGLFGHDRLGAGGGALDATGTDSLVQVVDVVEERVRQGADLGIEVAGDGQVDQQQRPALPSRQRRLHIVTRDQEVARVGRGDDDVGLAERVLNVGHHEWLCIEPPRDTGPPFLAAIRHEGDPGPSCDQPAGGCLADLAGADQQHLPAGQVAEDALGQDRGGGRCGRCRVADRSLRPHLPPDAQRLAEEPVEQRAGRPERVGGPNLAENLRLAPHARVEAGGDAEEVLRRLVVGAPIESGIDSAERVGGTVFGAGAGHVELGPIAGRKADGLPLFARELAREFGRFVRVERDPLAHLESGAVMRDADERELSQRAPARAAAPRPRAAGEPCRSARQARARAAQA